MSAEELFARYRLRVMRLPEAQPDDLVDIESVVAQAIMEAQENISDLLPQGWYCKIEED